MVAKKNTVLTMNTKRVQPRMKMKMRMKTRSLNLLTTKMNTTQPRRNERIPMIW